MGIRLRVDLLVALAGLCTAVSACRPAGDPAAGAPAGGTAPVYNAQTGRLEQLASDTDGDGKVDMRAQMDGARFKSVEIDRNGDGRTDRWEHYGQPPDARSPGAAASVLVRAEESNAPDGRVTRREWYTEGVIARVEEDTDLDGRIDKWEVYDHGALARLDLDLGHQGLPTRRFVYAPSGALDHVEADDAGTGTFRRLSGPAPGRAAPTRPGGGA